jgi:hypothetical protein
MEDGEVKGDVRFVYIIYDEGVVKVWWRCGEGTVKAGEGAVKERSGVTHERRARRDFVLGERTAVQIASRDWSMECRMDPLKPVLTF